MESNHNCKMFDGGLSLGWVNIALDVLVNIECDIENDPLFLVVAVGLDWHVVDQSVGSSCMISYLKM